MRRQRDAEDPEACDFRRPLRRFRIRRGQNRSRHLAVDQPVERPGLAVAELDLRRPRRDDRGSDIGAGRGLPVIDRNALVGQIGDRLDFGARHHEREPMACVVRRRRRICCGRDLLPYRPGIGSGSRFRHPAGISRGLLRHMGVCLKLRSFTADLRRAAGHNIRRTLHRLRGGLSHGHRRRRARPGHIGLASAVARQSVDIHDVGRIRRRGLRGSCGTQHQHAGQHHRSLRHDYSIRARILAAPTTRQRSRTEENSKSVQPIQQNFAPADCRDADAPLRHVQKNPALKSRP